MKSMPRIQSKTMRQLRELRLRQKTLVHYQHELRKIEAKRASISGHQRASFIKRKMSRIQVLLGYTSKISNYDLVFATPS